MRNIELKARLRDREGALQTCQRIGAESQGDIRQTDTYFDVPEGRLKLRECVPGDDYLVFYRRPDVADLKASDYAIEPATPAMGALLKQALRSTGAVQKVRTLWLWKNVRIHIDHVAGLGDYIEFEAVLSDTHVDADGFSKLTYLRDAFGVREADLERGSYLDLLHGADGKPVGYDAPRAGEQT